MNFSPPKSDEEARERARIALAARDPGQVLPLLEPLVRATDEADLQILASHLRAYLGE